MTTVGEQLVTELAARGVEVIFGIPGVHTIELYRGLARSGLRHVTPRHEQGAAFMADGYARVSGKPGVAFVITGPGVTNTLTAMGQARADSVPILTVSGVNTRASLGQGLGFLHELPDQLGLMAQVALVAKRIMQPADLAPALADVFAPLTTGRPGPVHIEIPLDLARMPAAPSADLGQPTKPQAHPDQIAAVAQMLNHADSPVILVGGGANPAAADIQNLAQFLDAPVIKTVNARGIMFDHPLGVPASPSLSSVRNLIESADVVLALGTELGPTDYDMYATDTMPKMQNLIRIDICDQQLAGHPATIAVKADVCDAIRALIPAITPRPQRDGADRAKKTRTIAYDEIGPDYRAMCAVLDCIRSAVANAIIVGDSAQPVYAGNMYYDHDRVGGWFNAATGFGALGYGIPAAIGAAIADPSARVICLVGDGGAQFSMSEMMVAVQENLDVTFIVWNNHGYQEIATSMQQAEIEVVGCDPIPPDFEYVARSCGLPFWRCASDRDAVADTLARATPTAGPKLIEIIAPNLAART